MPRFAILVFPGSNCENDVRFALDAVGQEADLVWHKETSLDGYDAAILPGGFAHGDYLRPGAIARFSPVMSSLADFAASGKAVVGICNGFQILQEAGLLPGAMLRNRSLTYICRYVRVRVEATDSPITASCRRGEILRIPVGHADGNYYAEPEVLERLETSGAILLRYCDFEGHLTDEANPNGSLAHVAAVRNPDGNVVGLMPHPDRCYEASLGTSDGLRIFQSLVTWVSERVAVSR